MDKCSSSGRVGDVLLYSEKERASQLVLREETAAADNYEQPTSELYCTQARAHRTARPLRLTVTPSTAGLHRSGRMEPQGPIKLTQHGSCS